MLDVLITRGYLVTMTGPGTGVMENGAIGFKGNQIVVVGKAPEVEREYKAHRFIDATNKAVLPGFIDAHIHTGIAIMRGLAQDVDHWMQKGLWPFAAGMTKESVLSGSLVNIIEGVKAGTTTFCDYNANMREIVKNHLLVGTRARVADEINEMPEKVSKQEVGELYPLDPAVGQAKLNESVKLIEEWHGQEGGRITCIFGPQGPDMLSRELLLEVQQLAEKYDSMIHMHVAQGDREIDQMVKRYGKRSIQYLEDLNCLNERLLAVHLTEATKEETQLLARRKAAMVLCSGSIGIIDGIVPPMAEFLEMSNRGALGSDQAPGNNCNNMFNEMKFTAILNKCRVRDPKVFPAWQVLRLATIDGARAIGLGDEVGSLEKGKKADIIMVDLTNPNLVPTISQPVRNLIPNLVYAARGNEVETVIIDGRFIVEDGKLNTVDEKEAALTALAKAAEMAEGAKENVLAQRPTLLRLTEEGYY